MDFPKYGDVLPNGAKVIYFAPREGAGEGRLPTGYVFADSAGQLVHWECSYQYDQWTCYWGYYFEYAKFPKAWADFCDRAGIRVESGS